MWDGCGEIAVHNGAGKARQDARPGEVRVGRKIARPAAQRPVAHPVAAQHPLILRIIEVQGKIVTGRASKWQHITQHILPHLQVKRQYPAHRQRNQRIRHQVACFIAPCHAGCTHMQAAFPRPV